MLAAPGQSAVGTKTGDCRTFHCVDPRFGQNQFLRTVGRGHEARQNSISCHFCGRTFKSNRLCTGHINANHLFTKPFICVVCSKGFSYETSLVSHQKSCRR